MTSENVPRRLRLQFGHIKDMIKEQNRMVLAEVEPTESEREDMLILLSEIKSGIEQGSRAAIVKISNDYEEIRRDLTELGYNTSSYSLTIPEEPAKQDSRQKSRKQVHFEDQGNAPLAHDALFPYKDEPAANAGHNGAPDFDSSPGLNGGPGLNGAPQTENPFGSAQIYDQNNLIFEDQDRRLMQISDSVGRQRSMGEDINSELGLHNNLLEDVEAQVDRSQTRLDGLTNGVKRFNHKARECGVCSIIMALILVLFILIIL